MPWFPLKTMDDARAFYQARIADKWDNKNLYYYAICLKDDNYPIGYINTSSDEGFELGYGLRSDFWYRGIAVEAGKAIINQVKIDRIPYITATHDVKNPRSGNLMKKLGMKYQYSYREQWQPKNISVVFRMYQLNLDGQEERVYKKYWNSSSIHFIEENI